MKLDIIEWNLQSDKNSKKALDILTLRYSKLKKDNAVEKEFIFELSSSRHDWLGSLNHQRCLLYKYLQQDSPEKDIFLNQIKFILEKKAIESFYDILNKLYNKSEYKNKWVRKYIYWRKKDKKPYSYDSSSWKGIVLLYSIYCS